MCASIGGTSFWEFTGQASWCGTVGSYGGPHGDEARCPAEAPTWCICKWAFARWAQDQCDRVHIDCEATDVCDMRASYVDYGVSLREAQVCLESKCPMQWAAC